MGIKIPENHIVAEYDLKEFRRRMSYGRHRRLAEDLNLTSLIDMFSVIIFFLLQSFSVTGEILLVNKDIKLPVAQHAKLLERAPIVTIMQDRIFVEGSNADSNSALNTQREEFEWDLPKLANRLREYRRMYESIYPGRTYPGDVIVQADKALSFVYLKRVMYTLVKEGFSAINLVVRGRADLTPSQELQTTNEP